MAILNGILKKLNGSAGSLTFKQVNGQTVVSEKATEAKNTRTPPQTSPSGDYRGANFTLQSYDIFFYSPNISSTFFVKTERFNISSVRH